MGGFTLDVAGVEIVLDYESFFELLKIDTYNTSNSHGKRRYQPRLNHPVEIAFPKITAAEIQDKARGDFLSKMIVILQSLWFIVQCTSRGKQGFALTELELVTLALVSLNAVIYYFWWDKPLGIKVPIKLYPLGMEPNGTLIVDGAERLVSIALTQTFLHLPFTFNDRRGSEL